MKKPPDALFIDGEWVPAADGARIEVENPATEEVIGSVPFAGSHEIDRSLKAAEAAFDVWRRTDAWTRSAALREVGRFLLEHVDEIALTLTEEQGKPIAEARAEVVAAADQFDWCADEARRIYGRVVPTHTQDTRISVLKQPIGPVAAFTPWNFPMLLPARKIAPALAAGCSIVVKPAEETPRSTLYLGRAAEAAGIPPGVVNIIYGDPEAISSALIAAPAIRKVTLTGSLRVGRELGRIAGSETKPISLELGGHSPVIVLPDADLATTAQLSAIGKFRNAGQVCISPSRWYVHRSLHDEFAERMASEASQIRLGDGRDPDVDMGPLTSSRRLLAVEEMIRTSKEAGAIITHGGQRSEAFDRGLFFEPTVLTQVTDDAPVMQDEPFGPIAPLTAYDDLDEAIARANKNPYGLAAYVFTTNLRNAQHAIEELQVGMVGVNNLAIARPEAPFGGVKASGSGREGGVEGIEQYLNTKYVNVRL